MWALYTKDVDIWIDNSEKNAKLVYKILKQFGAPVRSISEDFFKFKDHFFKMGKDPFRVDIICGMNSLTFSSAWKNRIKGKLAGVDLYYVGLEDLIILKKDAGRPQDLVDIKNLKKKLK